MTLNLSLRIAVRALDGSNPKQLTFKNVFHLSDLTERKTKNMDESLDILRSASQSIANISKREVSSVRVVHENRKVNVVVEIA